MFLYLDRNKHFYDVRKALAPLEAQWKFIGSALGLKPDNLNMIESRRCNDPSACLNDTVDDWLKQNYDVQRFGPPTWQKVVEVVGDEAAGRNPALAKKIASEHQGMYGSVLICYTTAAHTPYSDYIYFYAYSWISQWFGFLLSRGYA